MFTPTFSGHDLQKDVSRLPARTAAQQKIDPSYFDRTLNDQSSEIITFFGCNFVVFGLLPFSKLKTS